MGAPPVIHETNFPLQALENALASLLWFHQHGAHPSELAALVEIGSQLQAMAARRRT